MIQFDPEEYEPLIRLSAEKVSISLTVDLYFKASLFDLREPVIACFDQFLERSDSYTKWYSDSVNGKLLPVTNQLLERPSEILKSQNARNQSFSWIVHGGEKPRSASPLLFEATHTMNTKYLDYLRATFPSHWFAEDFSEFVKLAKDWATLLPVFHGYGGLAFSESPITHVRQANSRFTFALSKQFIGVEVENPLLTARSSVDGVKGVNWLTVVGEALMEKLGGIETLQSNLSQDITIHKFQGGTILQAGPLPRTGDLQKGKDLPSYREVAAALKPIRITKHFPLGPEELGSFGWQGTEDWLYRFDTITNQES